MKKYFFLRLALLLGALPVYGVSGFAGFAQSAPVKSPDAYAAIVPRPFWSLSKPGSFPLGGLLTIYTDDSTRETGAYLREYLQTYYQTPCELQDRSRYQGSGIELKSAGSWENEIPHEGYTLEVKPGYIKLAGGAPGVFYGVQTLLQLIRDKSIPCGIVSDYPRFPWRGLSLDVSRHFFSVETVEKYIDLMAHYKLNVFHWHLTDDEGWRIQIDKYPELTEKGSRMSRWAAEGKFRALSNITGGGNEGYYTKAQIREVVAYARRRYITVVPEIEMPGHSEAAIYAYPELGVQDSTRATQQEKPIPRVGMYDPSEKVFSFLQDVLTEVMELFPGKYIHIGGDEADMQKWLRSPIAMEVMRREGLRNEKEIQSYFIRRMEKFILSKGRQLVGWDEILEGGLAPSATVMSWRGEEGGIAAARMHHPVVMTPLPYVYFDAPQSDDPSEPIGWNYPLSWQHVYAYDPVSDSLTPAEAKYVLGAQGNIWAEKIPVQDHLEYMVYPRALALAEDCWTARDKKNIASFTARLDHQYELLQRWKVNARLPDAEGLQTVSTNHSHFVLLLSHPLKDAVIHYTLDGTVPDENAPVYPGPVTIDWKGKDSVRIRTLVRSLRSEQPRMQTVLVKYISLIRELSHVPPAIRAGFDYPEKQSVSAVKEFRFNGYLKIGEEGDYRLGVSSDGETTLSLDGQLLIDNRGYHGAVERESLLHLKKGYYRFGLWSKNEDGDARTLHLFVKGRSGKDLPLSSVLYHTEGLIVYVDPFIGTGGHGHTYPGATVPFGMVQLSPDNGREGWDWSSGYHYSDSVIAGFSHMHLSGTGDGEWCDISVLPSSGRITDTGRFHLESFHHAQEEASPGYYSVTLDNGIRAELTATERCGFHQYLFPGDKEPVIRFDLGWHINEDSTVKTFIRRLNDSTIIGYRYSSGWAQSQQVYFAARVSAPIVAMDWYADGKALSPGTDSVTARLLRAQLVFGAKKGGRLIRMKVALSMTNMQKALLALDEVKGWDFGKVRAAAADQWEREMEKIQARTEDEHLKRIFYTAMYHSCMSPVLYSDADGMYKNARAEIYKKKGKRYTLFSLWDTFRALHPLFTLIQPERLPDVLNSMLEFHDENSLLPVWDLSTYETGGMTGYHAVPVLADAILKGVKGIDVEWAYKCMKESATQSIRGTPEYIQYGYLPQDKGSSSVTVTLEYAYDDWCIAQIARKLGKEGEYEEYMKRSEAYKLLFDPVTGFMRARNSDGSFVQPFDPYFGGSGKNIQYREGNAWQYSFFVPQDVKGLIALQGGDQRFIQKLDALFAADPAPKGSDNTADVTGMIGQYAHGNEPSHHIAYLYSFAGVPWKTQEKVRLIVDSMYHDDVDGYAGNEDCGQMSAWAVWSILGLYPVNPAGGRYVFGSPSFDEAVVRLPEERKLIVRALNNSKNNIYIQSVRWNGVPYPKTWIDHSQLLQGGLLEFVMGPEPNKEWGIKEVDRP